MNKYVKADVVDDYNHEICYSRKKFHVVKKMYLRHVSHFQVHSNNDFCEYHQFSIAKELNSMI